MATTTLTKVVNCQYLQSKLKDATLSVKTAYHLAKLFKFIEGEAQFYTGELNRIIEKFGARDPSGNLLPTEDGRGVQIPKDRLKDAEREINELMNIEVELPNITLTLDELDGAGLTVEDVQNLEPFIVE